MTGATLFLGAASPGVVAVQGISGLTGYFSDVLQRALAVNLWEETGLYMVLLMVISFSVECRS